MAIHNKHMAKVFGAHYILDVVRRDIKEGNQDRSQWRVFKNSKPNARPLKLKKIHPHHVLDGTYLRVPCTRIEGRINDDVLEGEYWITKLPRGRALVAVEVGTPYGTRGVEVTFNLEFECKFSAAFFELGDYDSELSDKAFKALCKEAADALKIPVHPAKFNVSISDITCDDDIF